ncbi:hypothetical protein IZ6_24570 [Terrihabitans soli]|uniref:Uncharacterized protein n=1 Tax=Terrihabitans soli TaxID=708113 RepID=A0A6S6QWV3_9HYPH|nr:hypothetical protein [Terrihabitans soli]BCJ91722.1 hypothetical protein IZ6_24570 [Terrihabitans soli]
MKLYEIEYQCTNYVRVESGFMDSEFSHTEVVTRTMTIAVGDFAADPVPMLSGYISTYGGNKSDKDFKLISITEKGTLAAILDVRTR